MSVTNVPKDVFTDGETEPQWFCGLLDQLTNFTLRLILLK